MVWDTETVEVYLNTQRIALHKKSFIAGRSTEDAHMPENHLEYQHSKGRNAAFYLEEAEVIGMYTLKSRRKGIGFTEVRKPCLPLLRRYIVHPNQ